MTRVLTTMTLVFLAAIAAEASLSMMVQALENNAAQFTTTSAPTHSNFAKALERASLEEK